MTKKVKEVKEEVKRIGEGELKQILEVQKSMTEILQQLGIINLEDGSYTDLPAEEEK